MEKVAVLLSTYNGVEYLEALIESILNQDYSNFQLFIRDDGSTDNTKIILSNYARLYPNKVFIVNSKDGQIGVKNSFDVLLRFVDSDIYFFSDQDDIWMNNKIRLHIESLHSKKNYHNDNIPLLSFSDMSLIINNKVISEFYLRKKTLVNQKRLETGFLGNVSGCLMMFNKAARNTYLKYNTNIKLHDYHMYFLCYIFGNIFYLPIIGIHHRIHLNNMVGLGTKQPLSVEFKDLLKYLFLNNAYCQIALSNYFAYVAELRSFDDINELCLRKKIYNMDELMKLKCYKRKIWFFQNFFSLEKGFARAIIRLFLI